MTDASVAPVASEIPITVLDGAQGTKALAEDLSLGTLITPSRTTVDRVRRLCLPDGSRRDVRLESRLREFPPALRYDTRGLELYEQLMELEDEYYVAACERAIFETRMETISKHFPNGASIVELGCGSMTKTAILLEYLRSKAKKTGIKFYALDIDEVFLKRSVAALMEAEARRNVPPENAVAYTGILGSYEQENVFLPQIAGPRVIIFLGASLGNFTRVEAAEMLRRYSKVMDTRDAFFVAIDKKKDAKIITRAYNDERGVIRDLGMNNLVRLNTLFGYRAFDLQKFDRLSGYNEAEGQVESYIQSLEDQTVTIPSPYSGREGQSVDVALKKGELIRYHIAVKYSVEDLHSLAVAAEMVLTDLWTDPKDMCYFCMFQKAAAEE